MTPRQRRALDLIADSPAFHYALSKHHAPLRKLVYGGARTGRYRGDLTTIIDFETRSEFPLWMGADFSSGPDYTAIEMCELAAIMTNPPDWTPIENRVLAWNSGRYRK